MSNYDRSKLKAAKLFLTYDQNKMIEDFHLKYDEKFIYLRISDVDFKIDRINGLMYRVTDDLEAGFEETLTAYDLLCYRKKDSHISNEMVLMHSLAKTQNASGFAGEGGYNSLARYFEVDTAALEKAMIALGGIKMTKGDVAYRISMYEDLDMVIEFWDKDEDFDASMQIFMDKNTLDYMHYETCWYISGFMIDRLKYHFDKIRGLND